MILRPLVNIPHSVTEIGRGAFADCSSLESINIPDLLTVIGNNTFGCCSSLESINIPHSVTDIGMEVGPLPAAALWKASRFLIR